MKVNRHVIPLPTEYREELLASTADVADKQAHEIYVSYPTFVDNLFKEMDTVAASLHHATTGIAGEGGELLDVSKKTWIYGKPLDVEHLIEELGDLRYYYQQVLNMLGLSDKDIQAANMRKLMKRYPDGVYSDKHAQQRLDKAPGSDRKFFGQQSMNSEGTAE